MHIQSNSTHFCVIVCMQISSRKCSSKRGIKSKDAMPLLHFLFRPSSCKRSLNRVISNPSLKFLTFRSHLYPCKVVTQTKNCPQDQQTHKQLAEYPSVDSSCRDDAHTHCKHTRTNHYQPLVNNPCVLQCVCF